MDYSSATLGDGATAAPLFGRYGDAAKTPLTLASVARGSQPLVLADLARRHGVAMPIVEAVERLQKAFADLQ